MRWRWSFCIRQSFVFFSLTSTKIESMTNTNGVTALGQSPDHDPHKSKRALNERGFPSHLHEPHLLSDVIYDHFFHILCSTATHSAWAKKT